MWTRLVLPFLFLAMCLVMVAMTSCSPIIVTTLDRPGCSSWRLVTTTRQSGQPTLTKIEAWRLCGQLPPPP